MSRKLSRSSRTRVIVSVVLVFVAVVVGGLVFFCPLLIHYSLLVHTGFVCLSATHSQCEGRLCIRLPGHGSV